MAKRRHRTRYKGPDLTGGLGLAEGASLELRLSGYATNGAALATIDDIPVEAEGGIDGELVRAEILRIWPDRVVTRVTDVIDPSPHRVAPPCPYVTDCSGCQWQHISYGHQLTLKRDRVREALSAHGSLASAEVMDTLPSEKQFGYRNHARFTVWKGGWDHGYAGFVNATTRRFVRIDRCMLMDDRINEALAKLQGRLSGESQMSVRVGVNTGSMLVQPKLKNAELDVPSGAQVYEERVSGLTFRVAASSFFQVNTPQLENLAGVVRDALGLTGLETVVDAYCGVGTFTALLAPHARGVTGIEESASAVADARLNSKGLDNVRYIEAKSEVALDQFSGGIDALVLDPPRRGCHPDVLDAVCRARPRRVAMVSCEPAAMARDLARLCNGPFKLVRVQPVDMFPQTRHVEAVASLVLQG